MAYSYKFVEDEQKKEPIIWPKRVQILIDDYLKAGKEASKKYNLHYTIDTLHYTQAASYKIKINSIYRVKNLDGEEFYYYSATKTCKDELNDGVKFTHDQYGYHRVPVVTMRYNENKGDQEPSALE